MAEIETKEISLEQEKNIAIFRFPNRMKNFEKFKEHLLAILYANIQVAQAITFMELNEIKVKITGVSGDLDLVNFRNIICGIAKQH